MIEGLKKFLTFLKQRTGALDCEVITCSINMYCCYYKCFHNKIVKYLYVILQWLFHTEFKGDANLLGGVWGACPVKIMILEVRFLLTNFDSTSAIFNPLTANFLQQFLTILIFHMELLRNVPSNHIYPSSTLNKEIKMVI